MQLKIAPTIKQGSRFKVSPLLFLLLLYDRHCYIDSTLQGARFRD